MDTNGVGSSAAALLAQMPQRTPESAEVRQAGQEKGSDAVDAGANAVQEPAPTVNLKGETIGRTVDVKA